MTGADTFPVSAEGCYYTGALRPLKY